MASGCGGCGTPAVMTFEMTKKDRGQRVVIVETFVNFCIYYRQTDINVLIQSIYKKKIHFTEFLMDKTQ